MTNRTTALSAAAMISCLSLATAPVMASTSGSGHKLAAGTGTTRSQRAPSNGRIFFSTGFVLPNPDLSGNWQVYSVRPDGTRLKQLTHVPDGSAAGDPSVSPDGTTVAYVSNESGQFDLRLMDADGTHQRQLLAGSATKAYLTPSWSPDGSRLVVSACHIRAFGFQDFCDLVTVRSDGTHIRTVVADHRYDFYGRYSPNGRWIEFSSDRRGYEGAIWVVRSRGGRPRLVTPPRLEANGAEWAPNGRHIVVGSNCCQADGNIYRVSLTGRRLTKLTHAPFPHFAGGPTYSPDGRFISFISDMRRGPDSPEIDIFVMHADGTHVRRIETSKQPAVLLSWGRVPDATRSRGDKR